MMDEKIKSILGNAKTIAIVGISNKVERDSYKVAHYLQQQGYRVIAINPVIAGTMVLGEMCYANLIEAKKQTKIEIDIVDCFRKTEDIMPIAMEAIQIKAKCLWQQLGVLNESASKIAEEHGLLAIMNKCSKIEHKKFFINTLL